jgi:hypothetical protein
MFKKIDTSWIRWPYSSVKPGRKIHNPLGEQGLNYSFVDAVSTRALLECLPSALQAHARILWVDMHGPFRVHAHRDTGAQTVINWYVHSGNGITRFYYDGGCPIDTYLGHSVNRAYDHESLTVQASFRADDGDCYILDTDRTHDVELPAPDRRTFISWGFKDLNYKEVLCHFE